VPTADNVTTFMCCLEIWEPQPLSRPVWGYLICMPVYVHICVCMYVYVCMHYVCISVNIPLQFAVLLVSVFQFTHTRTYARAHTHCTITSTDWKLENVFDSLQTNFIKSCTVKPNCSLCTVPIGTHGQYSSQHLGVYRRAAACS
jgi:hypothetical protein